MKNPILTLTLLTLASLQVACSEDEGGKGMTMAQICAKSPASCRNGVLTPSAMHALAGTAAISGQPQVVAKGTTPQKGQLPDTATLPASIEERAKSVEATMKAMNEDPDFALTHGTHTLVGANYVPTSSGGGGSSAEISVASVPEYREPAAQQAQQYAAPVADPNSVFSQPEANGVGAGR